MSDTPDKVISLGEFVKRVDEIRSAFKPQPHKELWFRGESYKYRQDEHKTFLRPTLYRPRKVEPNKYEDLKDIDDLLDIESELYDAFSHSAVQLSQERTEDENWRWDSYYLMQHHAVPTRLLDWSDGALIALYFAVSTKSNDGGADDAVVYVLNPDDLKDRPDFKTLKREWAAYVNRYPTEGYSEFDWAHAYLPWTKKERQEESIPSVPDFPLVLEFPHITRRVAAQRSRFVVFGKNPTWLADKFGDGDVQIKEIIVDGKFRVDIKRQLRDCGITESVIYPDLDGLGRELKQIWEDWA